MMMQWKRGGRQRLPRRVKTPTVLQMEAVECGAAALASVLGSYGRFVPLEELRLACGVSRDGSKASNIVRAARTYGLVAQGYRWEPECLKHQPGPMIVHWNFNHFVVLEGFGKGKTYLNDPAVGPRVVTEKEFDEAFTGVVLTFAPGPHFSPGGQRRSLLSALGRRLRGAGSGLLYAVLAGVALVVPGLIVPTFPKVFVDDILIGGARDWKGMLLLVMGAAAALLFIATWLQQSMLLRIETRLAASTSGVFFWHVLRLPLLFFTQRYGGEIAGRVAINDKVARMLSGELATTLLSSFMVLFYAGLMLQYSVALTVLTLSVSAVNLLVLKHIARRRQDASERLLQEQGKLTGVAMGGLQMIETLKATGAESDFFTRWAGYHARALRAHQQVGRYSQVLAMLPPLLVSVNTVAILYVGALYVMQGDLSMGMLVAFQALMLRFVQPVGDLVAMGSRYQEVAGDMNRLDDVLRALPEPVRPDADIRVTGPARLEGYLELKDVCFGYSRLDPPWIEHFNLRLSPGMRVALIGGSGSGKSTIAKLICGLYTPWSGEVRFDGRLRKEIPRSVWTSSLAYVDQDVFLFEGSVKENITLWNTAVPEADVVRAARDACIDEVITSRPQGYESSVEEGGHNFSGGQRQRLELARALAVNPSLLVLDEATSALDAMTEKMLDDNLRRRGCTSLIVAHRLSTIRDCDEIIVMERGKVVQRGTHEQLAGRPGPYTALIRAR